MARRSPSSSWAAADFVSRPRTRAAGRAGAAAWARPWGPGLSGRGLASVENDQFNSLERKGPVAF